MAWQDVVLTVGSSIFVIALIPSILSKDKPALFTSITIAIVLAVFSFVYATLSLWITAITVTLTSFTWAILAIQKYRSTEYK